MAGRNVQVNERRTGLCGGYRRRVYVNASRFRRANSGERSRNVIDTQGRLDLSRSQGTKQRSMRATSLVHIQGTVTTGKVPVTAARRSKIRRQAGMSKLMSDVRGYVGGCRRRVYVNASRFRQAIRGERSRNVIDTQGRLDLCRSQGTKQRDNWNHIPPHARGTVTTGKVLVYGGETEQDHLGGAEEMTQARTGNKMGLLGHLKSARTR